MREINYLELFKKSFRMLWRKKALWVFGFFILVGSGGNGIIFNWDSPVSDSQAAFFENLLANKTLLALIMLLLAISVFLLVALRIIGQASLIKFAGNKKIKVVSSFPYLFIQGKNYLGKLFLLDFLLIALLAVLLIILSLPVVFLALAKSKSLAILVGLFALMIFLPVSILLYFVKRFSYMYIVLSDLNIRDSIENAYVIFKDNILRSLIFSLLLIGAGIFFGLALIALILVVGMPLLLLGFVLSLIFSEPGIYFSLGIGLLLLGTVLLLAQSAFESFRQISWTLFFKELGGVKIEQTEITEKAVVGDMVKPENA